MSTEEFEKFMEKKAIVEKIILDNTPVIITTCKAI